MTLGFNDSPGFRTGAALEYHPWSLHENSVLKILTCPLILMDSHLYSYQGFHDSQRKEVMQKLVSEVVAVRGKAAILWHPHTISDDFGWGQGFQDLLEILKKETQIK